MHKLADQQKARQATMKLCTFFEFPGSLECGTATSSFGDKVLAFAINILAELPQYSWAPMVIQTCLMREMVRFDLNTIRSSLPKLPFLSFWKHSVTSVFPCLSCSLFAIACSPVTSVSSEYCFSVAGEMSRSRRASLSASTLPFCHGSSLHSRGLFLLYIFASALCVCHNLLTSFQVPFGFSHFFLA